MTREDKPDPEGRIKGLISQATYLQRRLRSKTQECDNLRADAERWKGVATREHKHFIDTHNALNLLRQDAMTVMQENGVEALHQRLRAAREEVDSLNHKLVRRRAFSRRVTQEMAEARQEKRDLEEVVVQLNQKITDLETQLEQVTLQAETTIGNRDDQFTRFRLWCERWVKGEVSANEVMAALTMMVGSDLTLDTDVLERRRAVERAEILALLNEATAQLGQIVEVCAKAGIDLTGTPLQMAKELVDKYLTQGA